MNIGEFLWIMPCEGVSYILVQFWRLDYKICLHRFLSFQTSPPYFDFVTAPTKIIFVPHSLDKQWLEEFVIDWCCFYYFLRNCLVALLEALFARLLQITVLNDRRISIAKQKSDSRATQELDRQYHLVHTGNRSLICWQQIQKKILFARTRNETNPWYEFWGRLNR